MGIKKLISLIVGFVLLIVVIVNSINAYNSRVKYYDRDGTMHLFAYNVVFTDADGNSYTFDFDKGGYDYLYINSTDKRLNADLCYLNSERYICYDDDWSIIAKDENSCVDTDGSIYYPARFACFNEYGSIRYSFNSANFRYDRSGNAYTYDYIPYYDSEGNRYIYSFDSSLQEGVYTNISTNESFDNENSFVDKNGYFVYDSDESFTKLEDSEHDYCYEDTNGNLYIWASSVTWDKDGNILDSLGNKISLK